MQILSHLTKAGKFPVEQIGGIPHLNQAVDLSFPRTGVIHTTEKGAAATDANGWDGALSVFKQHWAPHFLVGAGRIAQLVQIGTMSAALVSNNVHAIVQIEVVADSQQTLWLPDEPTLDALASLLAACQSEYGIPLAHPFPDGDWGRYGDNPHRHAGKWGAVAAWYGHADVPSVPGHPEEDHWDPGNLRWSALLDRARSMTDILHAPATIPALLPACPCSAAPPMAPAAPGATVDAK